MPISISFTLKFVTVLVAAVGPCIAADPNDWVNINYVLQQSNAGVNHGSTSNARAAIIGGASTTARKGPWSVTNSKGVVAPSNDPRDYLSWAPYHWPNCNWCSNGRKNIAYNNSTQGDTGADPVGSDAHDDVDNGDNTGFEDEAVQDAVAIPILEDADVPQAPIGGPPPIPTQAITVTSGYPLASTADQTTSGTAPTGTPPPAQAPARTSSSSCTSSPTSSLAPSATWTTCPYVVRDGQVNPDVRTLNGPDAITGVSQSVLYNAIAYVLQKSAASSQNVAHFIDTFFLSSSTKMNPNMNYGQIVRGPGKSGQMGTFTGILDLRGIVKVVNSAMLMKASGSSDWTSERDQGMQTWMEQYGGWLQNSALGQDTASRPNNHGTFYVSQLTAVKMHLGDNSGAKSTLQNYFSHQFLDQIAASGEQPFEAVRTRPFHYRCFNLEAMITNAKLGDQLGLNLWTAKSKYGATIQTALDYTMSLNAKNEDVTEVLPHVAAIAAAYGDPKGKYTAFLTKTDPNYQSKPYWLYDQTPALPNSPAAKNPKRSIVWAREDSDTLPSAVPDQMSSFECPAVFILSPEVEIDDGIFVTCDELEPFYNIAPVT